MHTACVLFAHAGEHEEEQEEAADERDERDDDHDDADRLQQVLRLLPVLPRQARVVFVRQPRVGGKRCACVKCRPEVVVVQAILNATGKTRVLVVTSAE